MLPWGWERMVRCTPGELWVAISLSLCLSQESKSYQLMLSTCIDIEAEMNSCDFRTCYYAQTLYLRTIMLCIQLIF